MLTFNKHQLKQTTKNVALILCGLLIAIAVQPLAAEGRTTSHLSQAMAGVAGDNGHNPSQPADMKAQRAWASCTPIHVTTYIQNVSVQCAAAVGQIRQFAVSVSDSANAARVLSVITTAQVAGRTLRILYEPSDLSGGGIGCPTSDCRLILAVGFGQ